MQVLFLSGEDPPDEEMAIYSSILAWEIPWTEEPCVLWTEEPGVLQSMGLQRIQHERVGHVYYALALLNALHFAKCCHHYLPG